MGNAAGRTTQAKKTSNKEDGGHASAKQAQSAPKGWPSRVQRGARDNEVLRRVGEAVQRVPLELWVIIFENLFSSFQHDLDALSDLQNCIRVCSAWHEGVLMGGGSRILLKARHQKEEAELWQHLEQQVKPRSTTLLLPRHDWEDEGYAKRRLYVWMRLTEAHNPMQSGSSQSQKEQKESVPVRKKGHKDGEEAEKESEALRPFEDDPEVKRKRLLRWYGLTDTKEEGNGKEGEEAAEEEDEGGPVLSVLLAGLPASGKSSVLYYLKHGQPAPQPPDDGGTTHVEEAVLGDHRMLFLESRGSSYGFPFNSEVLSLLYVVDLTRPKHLTEKQMAARKTELEHLQDLLKQQESKQQAKSKAKHKQRANAFLDDWEDESTPKWGPENKFFPCWSGHPSYSLAEESRLRHELYYDFHSVCGHGNQKRIQVAVLCNKADLLTEEEAKAAMSDIEQHLRLDALWTCSWYVRCLARTFAVSAKTGRGLDQAIRWLVGVQKDAEASRS